MKYGIIADIHSNLEALQVVLRNIKKETDKIVCLGDIVGYGPNPNECVELIRNNCSKIICGNHDLAAVALYDINDFNPYAKEAILWTIDKLTTENKLYLKKLALTEEIDNFTIVHGSLSDPASKYIVSISDAAECFSLLNNNICFIGHTHVAQVYIKEGNIIKSVYLINGGRIKIVENIKYIINCGSVGQPRDNNPLASFGIYDLDNNEVIIKRVEYPISITQEKMQEENLPPFLYERLAVGR